MTQHPADEYDKYADICEHTQPGGAAQERVLCLRCRYPEPPRRPEKDAGDWYANKAEAARHWSDLLEKADAEGASGVDLRYLRSRLESARYVGD